MKPGPEIIEMDLARLESLLHRAEQASLSVEDRQTIRTICESYLYLTHLIDQKSTTIARLRKLLFGEQSEKTAAVTGRPGGAHDSPAESDVEPRSTEPSSPESKPPGHGRNGVDDYPGAPRIRVAHPSLAAGDACPECGRGTLYAQAAGVLLRFTAQAPVQATVYELEKLRCHLCGQLYTAEPPAGVGMEKYDATVVSMVGLLKYGTGVPFNRLDTLQASLQVPLPASTQWKIVSGAVEQFTPVHQELIRQAADGEVVHNDDTTVKILELMNAEARAAALAELNEAGSEPTGRARTGLFTSGVVATRGGQRIALFFSGLQHAGENLQDVLRRRAMNLPPPIQMCDALSRNLPKDLHTIVANCLAHARRQFVDVHDRFPAECGVSFPQGCNFLSLRARAGGAARGWWDGWRGSSRGARRRGGKRPAGRVAAAW